MARGEAAHRGGEVSTVVALTPARWWLPGDLDQTIVNEGVGRGASRWVGCLKSGGAKGGAR
jgi:hypothetical protein